MDHRCCRLTQGEEEEEEQVLLRGANSAYTAVRLVKPINDKTLTK